MQQLMKSMRDATVSSDMLDNSATKLGTEMLDAQYANKMTGLPGGLADAIARQLERQMGGTTAAPSAKPATARGAAPTVAIDEHAADADAGRFRAVAFRRGPRRASAVRHPGRLHDRPGRARIGLGQARHQEQRRQRFAQPLRHQGRCRLERADDSDHDDRIRRRPGPEGEREVPRLRLRRRCLQRLRANDEGQPALCRRGGAGGAGAGQRGLGKHLRAGPAAGRLRHRSGLRRQARARHQHHAARAAGIATRHGVGAP